MTNKWRLYTIVCCFLFLAAVLADNEATQQAVPAKDAANITVASQNSTTTTTTAPTTTTPTTTTTTPKPKVDVMNSALCKKCSCDKEYKQLDCSKKNLSSWFSAEEWSTLQNGDFTFVTINLQHNNLTNIPQLPDYPVENLYLGYNLIANIAIAAFSNLTQLTKLDLSHNKLTSKVMVPDVFKGRYSPSDYLPLEKLRELDLGYNELHNLDSDLFEHLPKLEVLILCKNIFQVIDHLTETAIAGLTSLKTLDLSYMELNDLPDNLLHGPRDLENLILSGNLLNEIPDNMELAINLKRLVLDENPMTDFDKESIFPAFKSLKYLSISYMPELKRIAKGGLSNLQNLTILVAANNPKLSYIDVQAFAKPTSNPEIFDYPPLEQLYLHNNNLSVLDRNMLRRWDKIVNIDLNFNPWNCDCSNDWLIHTLMKQINSTTPSVTKNVECNLPTEWKNVPLMDLNSQKKELVCLSATDTVDYGHSGLILLCLLVGILVGIPITLAGLVLYRRGCFGLLKRNSGTSSSALYKRASFTDDFHI